MIGDGVQVGAKAVEVNPGCAPESRHRRRRADEPIAPQGGKLPNRNPVARHDEGLAAVKLPHDLSAVVAQFTLSDLSSHKPNVARRATQAFILPQGTGMLTAIPRVGENPQLNCCFLVELRGFEPLTPTLPVWCATNCAIAPGAELKLHHRPSALKTIRAPPRPPSF